MMDVPRHEGLGGAADAVRRVSHVNNRLANEVRRRRRVRKRIEGNGAIQIGIIVLKSEV